MSLGKVTNGNLNDNVNWADTGAAGWLRNLRFETKTDKNSHCYAMSENRKKQFFCVNDCDSDKADARLKP